MIIVVLTCCDGRGFDKSFLLFFGDVRVLHTVWYGDLKGPLEGGMLALVPTRTHAIHPNPQGLCTD